MRKIGEFQEEKKALRFWNYLKEQKIDSSLEEDEGLWVLWVADEGSLDSALEAFTHFRDKPDDPKFLSSTPERKPEGFGLKDETAPKQSRYKEHRIRDRWANRNNGWGPVIIALVALSVSTFLLALSSENQGGWDNPKLIDNLPVLLISENNSLEKVFSGEIWRVFTPMFLHGDEMHIFMNMFALVFLGRPIERNKGSKFFLSFVLLLSAISNLAQFWVSGPLFGGMSGVVYGLFGYVFIKSRLDPGDGFYMDPINVYLLFGFFVACWLGFFGNIANVAHTAGLVVGLAWGYGSALRWNRGKK